MKVTLKYGSKILAVLFAGALLNACALTPDRPADYREAFPYKVSQEKILKTIDLSDDVQVLGNFVRTYLARGKGALNVDLKSGPKGSSLAKAKAKQITDILLAAGLNSSEVVIRHHSETNLGGNKAELSYLANTVKVPECSNWESDSSLNPTNFRHANFGCSTRRNIGLMVENPGDLESPRTVSQRAAPHSVHVINIYPGTDVSRTRGVGDPGLVSAGGGAGSKSAAESTKGAK